MSITNLRLVAGDSQITATWGLKGTLTNAVLAKIRPTASATPWSQAYALELPKDATGCIFHALTDGTAYQVQVSQIQFGAPTTATATPAVPSVRVNAAPTGPPTPPGGWKVIAADGFNPRYPLSGLWGPNAHDDGGIGLTAVIPPSNADEVAAFAASQVSLQEDGLHLSAIHPPGAAGLGRDYLSGCVISQNYVPGEPGQQGFPITGFRFLPTAGVVWVLEATITMPDLSDPGQDPNWSLYTPSWLGELDLPEVWGYGNKPYGYGITWINDTATGEMTQRTAYGDPILTDGLPHRWTHEINGVTRRLEVYVDGAHRTDLSFPWPGSFAQVPLYEVFSHAMRNDYGTPPSFTTGSKEMIVHDHGVYVNGPDPVFTGGLIAPGTVIA